MDYEQTVRHLQGWLGQAVSVAVAPVFDGAIQIAVIGGTLERAEQPSTDVKAVAGAAGSDDLLFFFVAREEGDRMNSLVLPRAFFEYSFTQPDVTGGEMLVITLRGTLVTVRLMPD